MPVLHLRLDRQRLRPARRPAGVRRHPPRHAQPRREPARAPDHAAHPGHRAGALRRRRLRDGRDPRRSPRGHGIAVVEDNAHGLFGTLPRAARSARFGALATQSFHETKNFTCGEGGALLINDPALRRARRDPAREGHQPQPLLPRPGGQVHLGGHRLELPAVRPAGGLPVRPARERASDPGAARWRSGRRYHDELADWAERAGRAPADRARRTASRPTTCSTCSCPSLERRAGASSPT